MKRNRLILIAILFCFCKVLYSQNILIGQLLSSNDSSEIPFAIVKELHSQQQVSTNAKGQFTVNLNNHQSSTIQIKKIGFLPNTYSIKLDSILTYHTFYIKADLNELNEIVIYGNQVSLKSETSNNIEIIESKSIREQGAMNLSDGIAKLPGVNQLSTGAGISKPVIRGLFGNRIQTVLMGMRFDNQQWQDEHGLGLNDVGVDKVEIIKGPAALFYGSEAMGGVINIINEKPAPIDKTQVDVSSRYFSNTNGYVFDAGIKKSFKKINYGIRLANESHADYSDGNNKRILNSRFGGQTAKAFLGFQIKNWQSNNSYLFAINNFGFLMDAYQLFDKADERWSRSFERPHHTVVMNLFTSQNTLDLKSSKLKVNAGIHFNNRQEQEGASGISLNMYLNTYALSATWLKEVNSKTDISVGTQNQYQTNVNGGSRIIVPDANLAEASIFAYFKNKKQWLVSEGGLRYDFKSIETLATGVLNNGDKTNPGKNILPQNKNYNTLNGSFGISLFDSKQLKAKFNFCSGYRGPNLAELSSNGLHEGSARWELGNVNLKIEQNFCFDGMLEYYKKNFSVFINGYSNRFLNYIYLQGSDQDYLGFKIYNYLQKNANINGLEGGIKIHPSKISFLQLNSTYSGIIGQTAAHENLPFIPAQKLNNEVRLKLNHIKFLKNSFMAFNYIYVLAQNNFNQFETATKAYQLMNASLGTEIPFKRNQLIFSVSGNNLSNESYYDHLSRFKYFGIYNMGRSINLNFKFQFNKL